MARFIADGIGEDCSPEMLQSVVDLFNVRRRGMRRVCVIHNDVSDLHLIILPTELLYRISLSLSPLSEQATTLAEEFYRNCDTRSPREVTLIALDLTFIRKPCWLMSYTNVPLNAHSDVHSTRSGTVT